MGGKKKYIEMFGSFTEPFDWSLKYNISILESPGKVLEFQ